MTSERKEQLKFIYLEPASVVASFAVEQANIAASAEPSVDRLQL